MPETLRIACRCHVCGRRVPHRRRDWHGRCGTCRTYRRRTHKERPYVLDGRRERRGQLAFAFDRDDGSVLHAVMSNDLIDAYWAVASGTLSERQVAATRCILARAIAGSYRDVGIVGEEEWARRGDEQMGGWLGDPSHGGRYGG